MIPSISTRTHAILDYVVAVFLIIVPLLFLGDTGGVVESEALGIAPYVGVAAILSLVAAGMLWLALALTTDYELGRKPIVPITAHLGFDIVLGLLLIASPWLLAFHPLIAWPHVLVGSTAVIVALRTERHTSYD